MEVKELLKLNKLGKDAKKVGRLITSFWMGHQQVIFIVLLLAVAILGSHLWYSSLYNYKWSEEKKNVFLSTRERDINLKEEEFNKVLEDIKGRKKNFEADYRPAKDIFKPYSQPVQEEKTRE